MKPIHDGRLEEIRAAALTDETAAHSKRITLHDVHARDRLCALELLSIVNGSENTVKKTAKRQKMTMCPMGR